MSEPSTRHAAGRPAFGPRDAVRISVIVPAYNAERELGRCLAALAASDAAPGEIIVVDDGSTDGTVALARELGAVVMETGRRQSGPAIARNLAARVATGDVLLFVDADVVIHPDVISRFASLFTDSPDITAAFGSYDDTPEEPNFLSQYKNLQHHFVHQMGNPESSTFWAGCGAVRKEIFLDLGGFDGARYPRPSIEDIELGFRLRAAGHRIRLDRCILSRHLKRWTFGSVVQTDVFSRAVPWTELILASESMPADLNLRQTERLSAVLTLSTLVSIPLAFAVPPVAVFALIALAGIAALNREFYGFLLKRRGWTFLLGAIPLHLLYYAYSSATFAFVSVRHRLRRTRHETDV